MGLMRIIIFTGKGGVGKTTVAAASALRAAELGHRTLVLSTDAAHSLADAFDLPLGGVPQPITPNLWGQETDMDLAIATHWGTMRDWLASLLVWRGMDDVAAQEMAILPGMEELANLLYILSYWEEGKYDTLVVDCAPTGETLRLLSFPEILHWWMEKIFPIERKAAKVIRPLVKSFMNFPFPEDKVFTATQALYEKLERMRSILIDPAQTTVRLVVNAEKMVIKEAQRTFTYLNLYGYTVDLVVLNRLLPQEIQEGYFTSWKEAQSRHRQTIEESFAPIPIQTIPLFEQEVVGMERLRQMGQSLYGEGDPTRVFFRGQVQTIQRQDSQYVMSLSLPFSSKEKISLLQEGDELIIHVGGYRRHLVLPRALAGLPATGARFEEGKLRLYFQGKGKDDGEDPRSKKRG